MLPVEHGAHTASGIAEGTHGFLLSCAGRQWSAIRGSHTPYGA